MIFRMNDVYCGVKNDIDQTWKRFCSLNLVDQQNAVIVSIFIGVIGLLSLALGAIPEIFTFRWIVRHTQPNSVDHSNATKVNDTAKKILKGRKPEQTKPNPEHFSAVQREELFTEITESITELEKSCDPNKMDQHFPLNRRGRSFPKIVDVHEQVFEGLQRIRAVLDDPNFRSRTQGMMWEVLELRYKFCQTIVERHLRKHERILVSFLAAHLVEESKKKKGQQEHEKIRQFLENYQSNIALNEDSFKKAVSQEKKQQYSIWKKGRGVTPPYRREEGSPIGLTNPPAILCYLNAGIQIVFASALIRKFVEREIPKPKREDALQPGGIVNDDWFKILTEDYLKLCEIQNALRIFVEKYDQAQNPHELETVRDGLKNLIFKYFGNRFAMSSSSQQDIGEFLTVILEAIDYKFKMTRTMSAGNCLSKKERPHRCLTIPISTGNEKNLQELIAGYTSHEMNAEWDPDPHHHFDVYRETYAFSNTIPNVLILQLLRFRTEINEGEFVKKKITDKVGIDGEKIDFQEWIPQDLWNENKGSTSFRLRSFAVHKGGAYGGHYFACVRQEDDQWVLLNDSQQPKKLTPEEALQHAQDGYYFLFERL